jgi:predicted RNA-binding Zn-ribbon protein involved in translation (DUF1610 family)
MALWDTNSLWLKAKAYIDKAQVLDRGDPDFGLWSSLALELLARAALSRVHPALNSDARDEKNLLYAFGYDVVENPRSLPVHSVYGRLTTVVPGFTASQRALCDYLGLRRNVELHTGELGFAGVATGSWLPQYYEVCKLLAEFCGHTLEDLLGAEEAAVADQMITAFAATQKKAILDKVAKHKNDFQQRPLEEQQQLKLEASARMLVLGAGQTQRICPACGSASLLRGRLIKTHEPVYADGALIVDEQYLADDFLCPACGLHLRTVAEIAHAGLDLHFTQQSTTDLHEEFQPEAEDDYMNM